MEWNEMVRCGISEAFGRIHIKKCGWKHLTMDETDTENKKYDEIAKKKLYGQPHRIFAIISIE